MLKDIKKNLNFFWNGDFDFKIPKANNYRDAAYIFRKNIVNIVCNGLFVFEQNPVNLSQTELILRGFSVANLTIDDLLQVKRYGNAASELYKWLFADLFKINKEFICKLHSFIAQNEGLKWGVFRDGNVILPDVDNYNPPNCALLDDIASTGFQFISEEITCPKERAFALFLFLIRTQFFFNANERVGLLMMNGVLANAGFCAFTIRRQDMAEFHTKRVDFCNTGNATQLMRFFERTIRDIYPDKNEAEAIKESKPRLRAWNR